jgi:hypothetical protein
MVVERNFNGSLALCEVIICGALTYKHSTETSEELQYFKNILRKVSNLTSGRVFLNHVNEGGTSVNIP